MVKYASQKKIYTATSTNAHYLNDSNARKTVESGLDRLIISIDGTTQETYEQYRVGGNLNRVIEGAENIIKWKQQLNSSTPHVIFQFLVVKPNEHQLQEMQLLAKKIGVQELRFKTAQVYDYEHGNPLIPTISKYARYKQKSDGTFAIKNKMLNHCWRLWHSTVITWDGLVVPCCFDKDAQHQLGDLKNTSFRQLWQGTSYTNFRSSLLRSRNEIDICKNCTEGTKVFQ
jgi:radical SAM protein with 4Fe4S-binding SPASM domain